MAENTELSDAIATEDMRTALIGIRDFLVHELEGSRCKTCEMSKLRTGDTAALVLRLQKVLEDIEAIPNKDAEVSDLDAIRRRRDGASNASVAPSPALGTRSAPRTQGGRTPRGFGP